MKTRTRLGMAAIATLALTAGIATSALAVEDTTSMSDWTTGTRSSARTASSSTTEQQLEVHNCHGSRSDGTTNWTSTKQQFQLLKNGAFGYSSVGNITENCGSRFNWGAQGTGQFEVQLNVAYSSTQTYNVAGSYLFAASPVYIWH